MSNHAAYLGLTGWHGIVWHPVIIIGETPKKYRIRITEDLRFPGGQHHSAGSVVLVPKHSIKQKEEKQ